MKLIYVSFMLFSVSAFSAWNEVECDGKVSGKTFKVEVERDVSGGPIFRPAKLTVRDTENGTEEVYDYSVTIRRPGGFNILQYSDFGLRLEVDLSPHTYPRFGWTYKGNLQSLVLNNQYIRGLKCRYPNAY